MNWYYVVDGESIGPLTDEDFERKVADGTITAQTLVWHPGMDDWRAYGDVAAGDDPTSGAEAQPHADRQTCCECRKTFPVADMIRYENAYVCGACKPTFFQRVQEGAPLPGHVAYGGFWIRFLAKMLDGIILGAVSMVFSFVTGFVMTVSDDPAALVGVQMVMTVLQMAVGLSYTVFFLGRYGATPGKMACRLKVVRSDGSAITYGRAAGRHFAEMLSGIILYIGYLMVAFDDEKRALHDRICDTRVIKVP